MRLGRLVFGACLALGSLVLAAKPAMACSCAPTSDEAALGRASAVFVGTPVERSVEAGDARWVFRVDRVYKGRVAARQGVGSAAEGAGCGLELAIGERALVFERHGRADLCNGTRPAEARLVPESFGSARAPRVGSAAIGGGGPPTWPLALAGVALVGVLGVVARARIRACPPSVLRRSAPN